jgi:hypothetical protein
MGAVVEVGGALLSPSTREGHDVLADLDLLLTAGVRHC